MRCLHWWHLVLHPQLCPELAAVPRVAADDGVDAGEVFLDAPRHRRGFIEVPWRFHVDVAGIYSANDDFHEGKW